MKISIIKKLVLCISSLASTCIYAQKPKGFDITGHIGGLEKGEKAIMKLIGEGWNLTNTDSGEVIGDSFRITGSVPEGPRFYQLIFNKHTNVIFAIFIDNKEKINISADDINKIPNGFGQEFLNISGSQSNYDRSVLVNAIRLYVPSMSAINRALQNLSDSMATNFKEVDTYMKLKKALNENLGGLLTTTPNKLAVPQLLYNLDKFSHIGHYDFLTEAYNTLSEEVKISFYGKALKNNSMLAVGQSFPIFSLLTPENKQVVLKNVLSDSKVTIVNFWANNSVDVDRYQQDLLKVYKKYHGAGLNIISVSSDTNKKKWEIAIQDIPWYQVSDLKGGNGIVENTYKEYGNPRQPNTTNILIDASGKIIAWDVSGAELQWYLKKELGF